MVILGNETGKWYLDLKNGSGACGAGAAPSSPDVTMRMKDNDFHKMFSGKIIFFKSKKKSNVLFLYGVGKLKPTTAFMTGKLKLEGDMGKAMKLEKLMGKMQTRSFHTMPNHQKGKL